MKSNQNTWMFLFFASILLWVGTVTFSCETAPQQAQPTIETMDKKANPCDKVTDDFRLTDSTALSRINRYKAYAASTFPSPDPNNPVAGEIINPDVRYFHLPRCELDKMLEEVGPGGDVKAHLAIKDTVINRVAVQEIVLVFGDSLAATQNWYDFVAPCPIDCQK